MTRPMLPLLALCLGAGCALADEPDAAATWHLRAIDGAPFAAEATVAFPEPGAVTGMAPCNAFRAAREGDWPDIAIGPIAATRRACPDLAAEGAFFAALEAMERAEVAEGVLRLTGADGREMVFDAQ